MHTLMFCFGSNPSSWFSSSSIVRCTSLSPKCKNLDLIQLMQFNWNDMNWTKEWVLRWIIHHRYMRTIKSMVQTADQHHGGQFITCHANITGMNKTKKYTHLIEGKRCNKWAEFNQPVSFWPKTMNKWTKNNYNKLYLKRIFKNKEQSSLRYKLPDPPSRRVEPMESISSMNMIEGACSL